MSRENVEVVLGQFADTNARDFAAAMNAYAEDVTLVSHWGDGLVSPTATGRAAVGDWFGDVFRHFGSDATVGRAALSGLTRSGRAVVGAGVQARSLWSVELAPGMPGSLMRVPESRAGGARLAMPGAVRSTAHDRY